MRTARAHCPTRGNTFRKDPPIITTLYDLVEAIRKEVGERRERLVPPIVMRLIASGTVKRVARRS